MMIRLKSAIPASRICNEFDRLFGDLVNGFGAERVVGNTPFALNVWQDETTVFVEAELPGVTMDQIEVMVLDNHVTIKGQRKNASEDIVYIRQECVCGEFSRTIKLPTEIDVESVSASLNNGLLKITLPKAKQVLPRTIKVQA